LASPFLDNLAELDVLQRDAKDVFDFVLGQDLEDSIASLEMLDKLFLLLCECPFLVFNCSVEE
jgi:hypothetical protein